MLAIPNAVLNSPLLAAFPGRSRLGCEFPPAISMPRRPADKER